MKERFNNFRKEFTLKRCGFGCLWALLYWSVASFADFCDENNLMLEYPSMFLSLAFPVLTMVGLIIFTVWKKRTLGSFFAISVFMFIFDLICGLIVCVLVSHNIWIIHQDESFLNGIEYMIYYIFSLGEIVILSVVGMIGIKLGRYFKYKHNNR